MGPMREASCGSRDCEMIFVGNFIRRKMVCFLVETNYSTAALRSYIAGLAPPTNLRIRKIRTDAEDELEE